MPFLTWIMRLPSRWRFILPVIAFLFGWGATIFYLGKPVFVSGASMYPTLKNGDCVLQYGCLPWSPLDRGDIVVLNDGQGRAVKRIIGLPGESIHLSGGRVLVNGFVLCEPYLLPTTHTTASMKGNDFTLKPGQYFVMGDNRGNSLDSRDYGPIRTSQIVGAIDANRHQPILYLLRPTALVRAQERKGVTR